MTQWPSTKARHRGRPLNWVVREQMDAARTSSPRFWPRTGWLAVGITSGVYLSLFIGVLSEWARIQGANPYLAPNIAFSFGLPFVIPLIVIAAALETLFAEYWFPANDPWANVILGAGYGSCALATIWPMGAFALLVTNPIVLRLMMSRFRKGKASAV